MKIILKTLTGKEHIQEVSPQTKVEDIKQTLSADYVTEGLHLCCNGSALDNTRTVEELGLQENAVLIIAGKKRKVQKTERIPNTVNPQPTEKTSSKVGETNTEEPTGGQKMTEIPPTTVPSTTITSTTTTTTTTTTNNNNNNNSTASTTAASDTTSVTQTTTTSLPSSFQEIDTRGIDPALIESIVAMGFEDRAQVALALRAAYMNPDRAVEFLCTGIPSYAIGQMGGETNVATTHPEHSAGLPDPTAAEGVPSQGVSGLRQALMNIPDFEEIRFLVQNNPQALTTVLQQLQLHNPGIFESIRQNPEEFRTIMMEGISEGEPRDHASTDVPLGEQEQAAVQRLVSLGSGAWTEHDAIIAYRVCEHNEEAAAQFLLDSFLEPGN